MRYHFFLHYGWFLQNLGKEAVRTNMHTTVYNLSVAQNLMILETIMCFLLKKSENQDVMHGAIVPIRIGSLMIVDESCYR